MDLRPELPPDLPKRWERMPVDRGYPVPWFATWIDGKPDFRVITVEKVMQAHRMKTCWLCGDGLGAYKAFVIGPMCAVNRTSGEPPSHRECADYAARSCPFLTRPHMKRNTAAVPEEAGFHPVHLDRNPGVTMVWVTKSYMPVLVPGATPVFRVGDPTEIRFYAEGRTATREEIQHSIDTGMPSLREMAEQDGPRAIAFLDQSYERALELLPA